MSAEHKISAGAQKIDVVVDAVTPLNELVTRFDFSRADGKAFPTFSAGAHSVIEMQDGELARLNPYSLMSDPANTSQYSISVRRDDVGRGGSLYMHQQVKVGDQMRMSYPINLFSLDLRAKKQIFVAGGIGITPFLAMIAQLESMNGNWELHYSCRSLALASYAEELQSKYGHRVHVYLDDQSQAIDLDRLLTHQPVGSHFYVCGPAPMIRWALQSAQNAGWPADCLHSEEFLAPQSGLPFRVRLCQSELTVEVGANESLLEAIERAGVEAPYLCRGGACGQCETAVVEHDGEFDHRDHWLEPDEHRSGKKIMPCVSRFIGETLVLDR